MNTIKRIGQPRIYNDGLTRQKRWQVRRLAMGLCRQCGKQKPKCRVLCRECAEKNRALQKRASTASVAPVNLTSTPQSNQNETIAD